MDQGVIGNVSLEDLPGNLRLRIEGADPSMPWLAVLTPEAALALSDGLYRMASAKIGARRQYPAQVQSGAQPLRRPPTPQQRRMNGQGGPQTSADGISQQPPGQGQPQPPPDDLLGEDFG